MQMQFIEQLLMIMAYTIDAPHSSHGDTLADCSDLDTSGCWMGSAVAFVGGTGTTF